LCVTIIADSGRQQSFGVTSIVVVAFFLGRRGVKAVIQQKMGYLIHKKI
jgi:hypothetical protein